MTHTDIIKDADAFFEIDPITRVITNKTPDKTKVMQYDHNSERFTFSMPQFVEGHDMLNCSKVEVHYINIDTNTKEETRGLYEVNDVQIHPEDSERIIFSWLLSQNVTRDAGVVHFIIRFSCVADDGVIEYAWSSEIYKAISVSQGIYNADVIVELYADVLEQWKRETEQGCESCVRLVPIQKIRVGINTLTSDIVTLGANWSGDLVNGFTHTSGSTEPLEFAINAQDGEIYLIEGTLDKFTETAFHLQIGDSFLTDPYGPGTSFQWAVPCVGNNGSFKIIPVSNYGGTITNLTCRKITDEGENEVEIYLDRVSHSDLPNHLSGFWNAQIGVNALDSCVNGTRNIGIGHNSLMSLITGGRNIGLGTFALPYMEYGENNIGIGADSGIYIKQAKDCICIGKATMPYGKDLKNEVAIGASALYGDTNKNDTEREGNIGIGAQAGYKAAGKQNVYIGLRAGYHNATFGNVFVGAGAGTTPPYLSTGDRLIVIGWNSGVAEGKNQVVVIGAQAYATQSNQIVIGTKATGTKANQVVIGNDNITETLLKGDLVVRGTDGIMRQIVFNDDGTCIWVAQE